jgi:ABC-2 type transport system permease protein
MLVMPGVVWMQMTRYKDVVLTDVEMTGIQFRTLQSIISMGMSPIVIFAVAVVMAMAVFSFLNNPRSANAMHALPVNRRELFVTNYLAGLSFMLIPQLITFFITVLTCLSFRITTIEYLLQWLLMAMGMTFFAYSTAVFVEMFTGQTFAVPVYFFIVNLLYVGVRFLIDMFVTMLCYGVTEFSSIGRSGVLSPLYYLLANVRATLTYSGDAEGIYTYTGNISGIEMTGQGLVAIYAVAAIVIVAVSYILYQKRKIESAGDLVAIRIARPIFRWGFGICCAFATAMCFLSLLWEYDLALSKAWPYIFVVAFGFVFFCIAQMMLEKNFKVVKLPLIKEWLLFAAVSIVVVGIIDFDVFGIESYVPDRGDIDAAFVYMYYPLQMDDDEIDELLEVHRELVDSCDEMWQGEHSGEYHYYYTTIKYYLNNGKVVTRSYAIPYAEEIADGSIGGTILYWETEPENIKRNMFGHDYENNEYKMAWIELVNENGDTYDYTFTEEDSEKLYNAIMKDIDEGNMNYFYTYLRYNDDDNDRAYYNSICFSAYNSNYYNDMWNYYDDYYNAASNDLSDHEVQESVYGGGQYYITFGPDCTNILKVLEDIGITDGLKTTEEMNEIWDSSYMD